MRTSSSEVSYPRPQFALGAYTVIWADSRQIVPDVFKSVILALVAELVAGNPAIKTAPEKLTPSVEDAGMVTQLAKGVDLSEGDPFELPFGSIAPVRSAKAVWWGR